MRTVDATPDLVPALVARMTAADRAALEGIGGPARLALMIAQSEQTWCGIDDAGPVNVGGVLANGYAWQVITPAVRLHKRAYIEQGRAQLERAHQRWRRIRTTIKADYQAALRHARRMGWTVPEPTDVNGTMACLCERTR